MESYIFKVRGYLIRLWQIWGLKAGISIFDQIVFSGAGFILHILLTHWLIPVDYGVFAIAFSIFLFLSGFYQALILEPISVIGAARYKNNLSPYLGTVVWIHIGITLILSSLLVVIGIILVTKGNLFAPAFLGLAIFVPAVLFFWFFRQVCYLRARPSLSLKGSLLYALLLFLGLIAAVRQNCLSLFTALFIIALVSVGASFTFWRQLNIRLSDLSWVKVKFTIKNILIEHWHYGKWVIGSAFTNWISLIIYLPLVGVFVGVAPAGAFKAMQNLFLPLHKVFEAGLLLLLPWLVQQRMVSSVGSLKRILHKFILVTLLISISYVIILILFKDVIIRFLYGTDYYFTFLWLFPWLGVVAIVESMSYGLCMGLRALQRPDAIFWAQLAGAMVTISIGIYLVIKLKLLGAVLGTLFALSLITLLDIYFLRVNLKRGPVFS